MQAIRFWNVMADAVQTHKWEANEVGNRNLAECLEAGDLSVIVRFIPPHESYCGWNDAAILASFTNDGVDPCWDGCDNILRFHRGGYCRHNQAHADMDCACDEYDHDYDEPF